VEGDAPAKRVAVLGDAPSDWRSVIETRLVDHGWAITDADRPPDDASPDPLDAVVFLELDPTAVAGRAFDTTDESTWDALAEAPARRALLALQRAHRATRHAGLVFVLVQPVVALEGSAELVAATTGWEAQRVLVKSAARRWGGRFDLRYKLGGVMKPFRIAPGKHKQ